VPAGGTPILGEALGAGDEIVLLASSGLHANGASLARLVADRLSSGYETTLPNGATLGEALLKPSLIYVGLVAEVLRADLGVSYMSHISGHGLLKLMRSPKPLTYRIQTLPNVPPVLSFLAAEAGLDAHTAYATFNMGSGYAVYCAAGCGEAIARIATGLGLEAVLAGRVEEGPRQVILEPVGVRYGGQELELSPAEASPSPSV
jgi:phosphoribosylformylglycinamidine cyclo-ligase